MAWQVLCFWHFNRNTIDLGRDVVFNFYFYRLKIDQSKMRLGPELKVELSCRVASNRKTLPQTPTKPPVALL
jgi:hypothetical protein